MKNKSLIDKDGEVRELTSKDFVRAKPVQKVMPKLVDLYKRSRGRPKADTTKQLVTIRLSAEVTEYFRSGGKGWQTRVDEVLQEYVRKHQ